MLSPFSRGENLLSPTPLALRGGGASCYLYTSYVYALCICSVYVYSVYVLCMCRMSVYMCMRCVYMYSFISCVCLLCMCIYRIYYVYLSCVYVQRKRYMRMSYVYMYILPREKWGVYVCVVCIPSPAEKRDRGGERSPPRKKRGDFPVKVARMVSFFGKISSCSMCI